MDIRESEMIEDLASDFGLTPRNSIGQLITALRAEEAEQEADEEADEEEADEEADECDGDE